jgi:hypothetical protein
MKKIGFIGIITLVMLAASCAGSPQTSSGGATATTAPAASAPAASTQQAAPAPAPANIPNGTYTFYPRPRVMLEGRDENAYLDKIIVRGGFFTLYFVYVPVGVGREIPDLGHWAAYSYTGLIYNLDQPNRPPLVASRGERNVDSSTLWVFNNHNVRRFRFEQRLRDNANSSPWVLEEINMDDADYQPL